MLTNSQHGFIPNHSTVTAMLEIANKWFRNIDIGQLNGVVFLDLKESIRYCRSIIKYYNINYIFMGKKELLLIGSDLTYQTESNIVG